MIKTTVTHEGKTYNASVQKIESVDMLLERDWIISLSICLNNCCLGGFVLGSLDKKFDDLSDSGRHLYDWVHAAFNLTGAKSFKDMEGKTVVAIWQGDGTIGDRIIGMASIDGEFVFIPGKKE